jgi:hypothetical protein
MGSAMILSVNRIAWALLPTGPGRVLQQLVSRIIVSRTYTQGYWQILDYLAAS